MTGQDRPERPDKQQEQLFDRMIPLAGLVLVLFATVMFGLFPRTPNNVIIAIALFGVGCAALWMGLVHADVQKTSEKLEKIKQKTRKVQELISQSKK